MHNFHILLFILKPTWYILRNRMFKIIFIILNYVEIDFLIRKIKLLVFLTNERLPDIQKLSEINVMFITNRQESDKRPTGHIAHLSNIRHNRSAT